MSPEAGPPVLVDTSVWVDFFNRPRSREAGAVRRLLAQDRVHLAGIVLTEMLESVRNPAERDLLASTFIALPFVMADRADWTMAGDIVRQLREGGAPVPIRDGLLAALCLNHRLRLFTRDPLFDSIAELPRFGLV